MAEKEGFEPTEPHGSDALQAPAFDHSATSPLNGRYYIIACQVCQTRKRIFLKHVKIAPNFLPEIFKSGRKERFFLGFLFLVFINSPNGLK